MSVFLHNKSLFLLLTLFSIPFCSGAQAGTTEDITWKRLQTRYTIISYQSPKDLAKFCGRVKYGPSDWGLRVLFSRTRLHDLMKITAEKTDVLFEKVQEILGMQKKMEKVRIHIYKNRKQLQRVYSEIYQADCGIRAWYRHENNTVYINANDFHEGMLAHELTHAIVDHYLLVRPPRPTAEIIARYVDSHLTRRARPNDASGSFLDLSY